jgi:hypothetical protein
MAYSGAKTGRGPADKWLIRHAESAPNIWWGDINIRIGDESFVINRERAVDYFNAQEVLYCIDGAVCWDPNYRFVRRDEGVIARCVAWQRGDPVRGARCRRNLGSPRRSSDASVNRATPPRAVGTRSSGARSRCRPCPASAFRDARFIN